MYKRSIVIICLALFLLSAGVRFLVWQNNRIEMSAVQSVVAHTYRQDARTLVAGNLREFIAGPEPPSNANILGHPPGYPIFIAVVWSILGENDSFLMIQIILNSLTALFVFAIALTLFEYRTALIAGILTAVAPQLAYHSGLMLPDELSVLPLLAALYFLVRCRDSGQVMHAIIAGSCIGLSCWLRANALLLPVFFVAVILVAVPRQVRTKAAVSLIAAFVLTVAPITIRNYVCFGAFVPLSLGSGTTFLEGLGDYDTDGRLGMPKLDEDVMRLDVARSGRPDYYGYLYSPDGVERDRARMKDGLNVIAANPGWFARAVAHRAMTSFRMERVPVIDASRDERETTPAVLYYLDRPLKFIQKVFVTGVILPLFLFGLTVMAWPGRKRIELLILAILPVYYVTVQSLLHTEYRYVLALPHIMLIIVAVGISYLFGKFRRRPAEQDEATPALETSHA